MSITLYYVDKNGASKVIVPDTCPIDVNLLMSNYKLLKFNDKNIVDNLKKYNWIVYLGNSVKFQNSFQLSEGEIVIVAGIDNNIVGCYDEFKDCSVSFQELNKRITNSIREKKLKRIL